MELEFPQDDTVGWKNTLNTTKYMYMNTFLFAKQFHFIAIHIPICMLSRFCCVRLFDIPWTIACQTPLSMVFSKQEYWSGQPLPTPGDLPGDGTHVSYVSCIGGWVLYHQRHLGSTLCILWLPWSPQTFTLSFQPVQSADFPLAFLSWGCSLETLSIYQHKCRVLLVRFLCSGSVVLHCLLSSVLKTIVSYILLVLQGSFGQENKSGLCYFRCSHYWDNKYMLNHVLDVESSSRDGNTRPLYLPSKKSVYRSRSNIPSGVPRGP